MEILLTAPARERRYRREAQAARKRRPIVKIQYNRILKIVKIEVCEGGDLRVRA